MLKRQKKSLAKEEVTTQVPSVINNNYSSIKNEELSVSEASNAQYHSISPKADPRALNPPNNISNLNSLLIKGQFQSFMDQDPLPSTFQQNNNYFQNLENPLILSSYKNENINQSSIKENENLFSQGVFKNLEMKNAQEGLKQTESNVDKNKNLFTVQQKSGSKNFPSNLQKSQSSNQSIKKVVSSSQQSHTMQQTQNDEPQLSSKPKSQNSKSHFSKNKQIESKIQNKKVPNINLSQLAKMGGLSFHENITKSVNVKFDILNEIAKQGTIAELESAYGGKAAKSIHDASPNLSARSLLINLESERADSNINSQIEKYQSNNQKKNQNQDLFQMFNQDYQFSEYGKNQILLQSEQKLEKTFKESQAFENNDFNKLQKIGNGKWQNINPGSISNKNIFEISDQKNKKGISIQETIKQPDFFQMMNKISPEKIKTRDQQEILENKSIQNKNEKQQSQIQGIQKQSKSAIPATTQNQKATITRIDIDQDSNRNKQKINFQPQGIQKKEVNQKQNQSNSIFKQQPQKKQIQQAQDIKMGNLQKIKEFQPLRQNFKITQTPQKPQQTKVQLSQKSVNKPLKSYDQNYQNTELINNPGQLLMEKLLNKNLGSSDSIQESPLLLQKHFEDSNSIDKPILENQENQIQEFLIENLDFKENQIIDVIQDIEDIKADQKQQIIEKYLQSVSKIDENDNNKINKKNVNKIRYSDIDFTKIDLKTINFLMDALTELEIQEFEYQN